jgi:hypothetical protein
LFGLIQIFVSRRPASSKFRITTQFAPARTVARIAGENGAMKRPVTRKLVVSTAFALGALALTFAAVALPSQAVEACSRTCMDCCH